MADELAPAWNDDSWVDWHLHLQYLGALRARLGACSEQIRSLDESAHVAESERLIARYEAEREEWKQDAARLREAWRTDARSKRRKGIVIGLAIAAVAAFFAAALGWELVLVGLLGLALVWAVLAGAGGMLVLLDRPLGGLHPLVSILLFNVAVVAVIAIVLGVLALFELAITL